MGKTNFIKKVIPQAGYKWVDKVSVNEVDMPLENKVTADDMNYLKGLIDSNAKKVSFYTHYTDNLGQTDHAPYIEINNKSSNDIYIYNPYINYNGTFECIGTFILENGGEAVYLNNAMNSTFSIYNLDDKRYLQVKFENTIGQNLNKVMVKIIQIKV